MGKIINFFALISLFVAPQVFADQEAAAIHAQDMAEAMQRQADAQDQVSMGADMQWIQNPSMENFNNSLNQMDAANAAQDAADSAQAMADELSGY